MTMRRRWKKTKGAGQGEQSPTSAVGEGASQGAGTLDPVPRAEHRVGVWDGSGVGQCCTRRWGKGEAAGPPLGVGGRARCPTDWATRCLRCRY